MKYLLFDTETTGKPKNYKSPITDTDNWPRLVQLSWIITNDEQEILKEADYVIKPDGFIISDEVSKIHGITQEIAENAGLDLRETIDEFLEDAYGCECIVGHNIEFDMNVVGSELVRLGISYYDFDMIQKICTMKKSTNYCKIKGPYGFKWPKLGELYYLLFNEYMENAHNALYDIRATMKCFFKLKELNVIK